jgi:hypothetical protein
MWSKLMPALTNKENWSFIGNLNEIKTRFKCREAFIIISVNFLSENFPPTFVKLGMIRETNPVKFSTGAMEKNQP